MVEILAGIGRYGTFSAAAIRRTFVFPIELQEIARHTWLITIRCAIPVVATVSPLGMVIALQGLQIFDLFGAQRLLSSLISVAVFRELAPVLASALVAAQGGSSFAAELGAMRTKEEIDATEVMGIDPIRVHVSPRVMAAIIATPMLNLAGAVGGIAGGYLVAVIFKGENGSVYIDNLWNLATQVDLVGGVLKSVIFGGIIGTVACYFGFHATGGAQGVGKAVNDTVVVSLTTFIVANYFLTSALFGAVQ